MRAFTFFTVVFFFLTSCTSLISQLVQSPKIASHHLLVSGFDLQKIELNLDLEIENPNAIDLPLEALHADLNLLNKPFLSRNWDHLPNLEAGKKTKVRLPLTLEWKDLWRIGANLFEIKKIPYALSGVAKIKGFEIPFRDHGQIDLKN